MDGLKNKDVIVDADLGTMTYLSETTRTSHDRLCNVLLPVCRVIDVPVEEWFEALKVSRDDISRWVGPVLCSQLNNMRGVKRRDNVMYDCLSIGDMMDLADLLSKATDLGAHGHMFSPAL